MMVSCVRLWWYLSGCGGNGSGDLLYRKWWPTVPAVVSCCTGSGDPAVFTGSVDPAVFTRTVVTVTLLRHDVPTTHYPPGYTTLHPPPPCPRWLHAQRCLAVVSSSLGSFWLQWQTLQTCSFRTPWNFHFLSSETTSLRHLMSQKCLNCLRNVSKSSKGSKLSEILWNPSKRCPKSGNFLTFSHKPWAKQLWISNVAQWTPQFRHR